MRFSPRICLKVIQHLALWLAIISFAFFILELFPFASLEKPRSVLSEEFDPALVRLDNIEKITAYCDSLANEELLAFPDADKDSLLTNIASLLIRRRFYHGGAEYGVGNNFMALFLQPMMVNKTVVAIVDIDDILKKPHAICGQQSRVLAALILRRGIPVRKILFYHPEYGGHYAVEAYYKGEWHFFDPDKEPDSFLAEEHDRPSLQQLQQTPVLLRELYNKDNSEKIESLFKTGKAYEFEAVEGANLLLYHQITYILSFCSWVIFGVVFLWVRRINHAIA